METPRRDREHFELSTGQLVRHAGVSFHVDYEFPVSGAFTDALTKGTKSLEVRTAYPDFDPLHAGSIVSIFTRGEGGEEHRFRVVDTRRYASVNATFKRENFGHIVPGMAQEAFRLHQDRFFNPEHVRELGIVVLELILEPEGRRPEYLTRESIDEVAVQQRRTHAATVTGSKLQWSPEQSTAVNNSHYIVGNIALNAGRRISPAAAESASLSFIGSATTESLSTEIRRRLNLQYQGDLPHFVAVFAEQRGDNWSYRFVKPDR